MSAENVGLAIVGALDEPALVLLAERLRPHLDLHMGRQLLTAAQAAERLGLHPKTVVRMAREGRLSAIKIGNGWRFHPDQLHPTPRPPRAPAKSRPALRAVARRDGERESVRAIRGDQARKAA